MYYQAAGWNIKTAHYIVQEWKTSSLLAEIENVSKNLAFCPLFALYFFSRMVSTQQHKVQEPWSCNISSDQGGKTLRLKQAKVQEKAGREFKSLIKRFFMT